MQQPPSVLLVDADRRVRTALRTLLTAAGFKVTGEAADATSARTEHERGQPDLVVVDPMLPKARDGAGLVQHLVHGSTTVIGLVQDESEAASILTAGATAVLTKGAPPEEVLSVLRASAEASRTPPTRLNGEHARNAHRRPMNADSHNDQEAMVNTISSTTARGTETHAPNRSDVHASLPGLVKQRVLEDGGHPALVWTSVDGARSHALTRRQLWDAVEAAAATLRRCGITSFDKVAILSHNDPAVIVATLAILEIGAAWLPVNSRESTPTIQALLDRFGCDAIVAHDDLRATSNEVAAEVPSVRGVLALHELTVPTRATESALAARSLPVDDSDEEIAVIFPTGGTSGTPKGVTFTHGRLGNLARCYDHVLAVRDEVYLAAAPLTHVGGRVCLSVLATGGTAVVLPVFEPREVLAAVQRHRVTTTTMTSTMLYRLLDEPCLGDFDTSSLQAISYGGGPTAVSRVKQALEVFGPVLEGGYGQTEAPMFISRLRSSDHVTRDGETASDARLSSVGRPTAVSEVKILDEHGAEVPAGTPGRIVVRGPFTMSGYYRDPQSTAARRVGDFQATGDLGFRDDEGYLTIVGRETDLIITGGFNVYPAEVENVIAGLPGVRECAVFGVPDEKWGECVIAVVSPDHDVTLEVTALQQQARAVLGGVKAPKRIEVVAELPRNDTGKILKRVLIDGMQS